MFLLPIATVLSTEETFRAATAIFLHRHHCHRQVSTYIRTACMSFIQRRLWWCSEIRKLLEGLTGTNTWTIGHDSDKDSAPSWSVRILQDTQKQPPPERKGLILFPHAQPCLTTTIYLLTTSLLDHTIICFSHWEHWKDYVRLLRHGHCKIIHFTAVFLIFETPLSFD